MSTRRPKPPTGPEPTTTYLIETKRETFEFTVPSSWKVTYGPVTPGSSLHTDLTLRFYEDNTRQRAVFPGVVAFRDTSLVYRPMTNPALAAKAAGGYGKTLTTLSPVTGGAPSF